MRIRTSVIAVAAASIVGTGAFVLPAAASARATTQTLQFTAETAGSTAFGSSTEAEQDTDINSAGKVVGYDLLYVALASSSAAVVNVTVDVSGGMLYGTATLNSAGVVSGGKITGGTSKFKGATGTFTVKSLNQAGTRHAVKITYCT